MANIPVDGGVFKLVQDISGAGTVTNTLDTENTFVDKDIVFQTVTPAGVFGAGSGSVDGTSTATGLLGTASSTAPSSGKYVKVEGTASVQVSTSGWMSTTDAQTVSIADKYYPVNEATFSASGASVISTGSGYVASGTTVSTIGNGSQTISGGALSAGAGSTALASDGLSDGSSIDATKKIALSETNANGYYELQASGYGTVSSSDVTKQVTTAGYFSADANPVTAISGGSQNSNTATKNYYVKQSTLSASSVTPSTSAQTVTISDGYYHEGRSVVITAMGAGVASSSVEASGLSTYFDSGTSSSYDLSLISQYSIDVGGYFDQTVSPVDGTPAYYNIKSQTVTETQTTVSGSTATRGTRTEGIGWNASSVTLDVATFNNTGTTGHTYIDISATTSSPVLVSGDYLYIDKGWTDDVKISLAKLVPDGSDVKGHSEYILEGHSAYDDDGTLVAGSIPTYAGAYTIS